MRGGSREGAGRKKGSANKATAAMRAAAAASGLTPLSYMLDVLRNPKASEADKKWASEKAAPYMHARLASVEHKGDPEKPVVFEVSNRELAKAIAEILHDGLNAASD